MSMGFLPSSLQLCLTRRSPFGDLFSFYSEENFALERTARCDENSPDPMPAIEKSTAVILHKKNRRFFVIATKKNASYLLFKMLMI